MEKKIHFVTILCTREIFFSTFYSTKYPCTIWGNYDMRLPVFFSSGEYVENYKTLAKEWRLFLEEYSYR